MQSLDVHKAAGPDGISGLFLKAVASVIAEPLTIIYNKSIQTGSVPLAWKRSNVTPVHKGGDVNDPSNFCPISVVFVAAKILEKIIANQLSLYVETCKLFHEHQGAYRCGKSSEQILLYAIDKIVNATDQHLIVCAAFLNLRKAFDSLDHVILLRQLECLGIHGIELKWFTDYLSGRTERMKCGDNYSNWGPVLGGIPQGSALGPLLFLIYVNNMPLQVQHGSLMQYADDTCLICYGNTYHDVDEMLCEDLKSLSSWITNSKMLINVIKSCVMWFSVRPLRSITLPTIYVDGHPLECVDTQKYLGLHIRRFPVKLEKSCCQHM